jgi:hypothetical protein
MKKPVIPLLGAPNSTIAVKINDRTLGISYDGRGRLKSMRQRRVKGEPKPEGFELQVLSGYSVFMRKNASYGYNFTVGSADFNPAAKGFMDSGTVWDDDGDTAGARECTFQEWVDRCALFLTGGFDHTIFQR